MRLFKPLIIALLVIALFSCEDSMNGPVGSDLTYEPQSLSVGEEVVFGTINKDVIKVKFDGLDGGSYLLKYPPNMCESCPPYSNDTMLELNMCNGKYRVTFKYRSTNSNNISIQLYKYERS